MNKGFTIIELIVSISIILVLTGLGIASYRNYSDREVAKQEISTLKSNLRLAQSKAAAGQKPIRNSCSSFVGYTVSFTLSSYTITPNCANGLAIDEALTVTLPASVTFVSPYSSFTFYPLSGGTSLSNDLTLEMTSLGNTYGITVTPSGLITE